MNKKERKKDLIFSSLALILVLIVGFIIGFKLLKEKDSEIELAPESELIEEALIYNEDGQISLVQVGEKKEKVIDSFDLKKLSTPRTETITETVVVDESQPTNEFVKEPVVERDMFKGFEKITRTIIQGENAWNIQESLTPNHSIHEMWKLLQELNNYSMHPIYPKETWTFLKEVKEEAKEEVQMVNAVEKEVTREVEIKEDSYIYYEDNGTNSLYAHSDVDRTVYSIDVVDSKIEVNKIIVHEDIQSPTHFVTDGENAFFTYAGETNAFSLKGNKLKEIQLHHAAENILLNEDLVIYTSGEFIGNYSFKKEETKQALIGGNMKNIFIQGDIIHLLHDFGKGLEKSLYFQLDTKNLLVKNSVEITSDLATLIPSLDNGSTLYLSLIEKTGAKNSVQIKDDKLVMLDKKTMKEVQHGSWKSSYKEEGFSYKGTLYHRIDEGLAIYGERDEEPVRILKIDGEKIMPILN